MKLKLSRFIFIFTVPLLIPSHLWATGSSFETLSSLLGTRVKFVRDNVDFCGLSNLEPSALYSVMERELDDIKKYAQVIKTDPEYITRVASQILGVAKCFSIDPLVFSSLIGHESFFYNQSTSHTGALGLGQLTSVSLKEIAQQLHAAFVPSNERGTTDAYEYWQEALSCIQDDLNDGLALKHWWAFDKETRSGILKKNTVLNLTYAAMIFKIAYSKSMSYTEKYSKGEVKVDNILKLILGYYNGASTSEKLLHYSRTRKLMNDILIESSSQKNVCFMKHK